MQILQNKNSILQKHARSKCDFSILQKHAESKCNFRPYFVCLLILCLSISALAQKIPADKNLLIRFEKSIDDGKIAEIERDLFNYVIANPNDASGFSLLAKMRLKQNRLNEAKSLANKALMLNSKLVSAKITLAIVLFQLGEIEQAALCTLLANKSGRDNLRA